ncbi:MAG: DUF4093 domain-containing protein [Oscillospiraceae bacterium]|nr:DUF4093 domain-containing protein [Oscillospiraceae bacterium]
MAKLKLNQAIIVEGKCDKAVLTHVISPDTVVIPVNGFGIYKDKAKLKLISEYAKTVGIILLTDSDDAGLQIRNYLKNCLRGCEIHHVYVPNSLEVEDTKVDILRERLQKFSITHDLLSQFAQTNNLPIDRTRLFEDGLIGSTDSAKKRLKLLKVMDLPNNLSTNALLDALNRLDYDYEQLSKNLDC